MPRRSKPPPRGLEEAVRQSRVLLKGAVGAGSQAVASRTEALFGALGGIGAGSGVAYLCFSAAVWAPFAGVAAATGGVAGLLAAILILRGPATWREAMKRAHQQELVGVARAKAQELQVHADAITKQLEANLIEIEKLKRLGAPQKIIDAAWERDGNLRDSRASLFVQQVGPAGLLPPGQDAGLLPATVSPEEGDATSTAPPDKHGQSD